MATDLTIKTGKRITITDGNTGRDIRSGKLDDFGWDTAKGIFYFNISGGGDTGMPSKCDYSLLYSKIDTVGGAATPPFNVLLAQIQAELDAE